MGTGSEVEEEIGEGDERNSCRKPGTIQAQPQWLSLECPLLWEACGSRISFLL